MQVVSPTEDLEVVAIWNQGFRDIVDLLWLLRLASSLRKDDIRLDVEVGFASHISFHSNQTSFLGVLEVEAMTFGNLSVDCLLDPGDLVYHFVPKFVKDVQREAIFCVDDPDEKESIGLDFIEWDIQDLVVGQRVVGNGNTTSRIG